MTVEIKIETQPVVKSVTLTMGVETVGMLIDIFCAHLAGEALMKGPLRDLHDALAACEAEGVERVRMVNDNNGRYGDRRLAYAVLRMPNCDECN